MKKILAVLLLVALVFMVGGCGPQAKDGVGDSMKDQPEAKTVTEPKVEEPAVSDDIERKEWDVDIEEEWRGLKTQILGVGIASGVESSWQEEDKSDVVYVKFRIENTREDGKGEFTTYPDQATLITSTGEQIEADLFESDSIGGELYEGVVKDGIVFWVLKRGKPFEIEWIRLKWNSYDEGADFGSKNWSNDHDVRIRLE